MTYDALQELIDERDTLRATISRLTEERDGLVRNADEWSLVALAEKQKSLALIAKIEGLSKALEWIVEQRWNEDADLDTICTHAEKAIGTTTLPDADGAPSHD